MIEELDSAISEQLNLIIYHENFRTMEARWQGLADLV